MLEIKVLGPGCPNCQKLEQLCREAVLESNIEAEIKKVTDYKEIMSYGVMTTPGLIVNGRVVLTGKLPTKSTLIHWLQKANVEAEK